jgi:hypothetical protein
MATMALTPHGFTSMLLMAGRQTPFVVVGVPQESNHSSMDFNPLSASASSFIKKNVRVVNYCGSNDTHFLNGARVAAQELEKELVLGCKLIEMPGVGHAPPSSIAEGLDYLDAPRASGPDKSSRGSSLGLSASSALAPVESAVPANPARARTLFAQLWENHPELRADPLMADMLKRLETLP